MIQGLDYNGVTECLFEPVNVQTDRSEASGDSITLTVGHPRWNVQIRVETPVRQSKRVWRSWITAREGLKNPFLISRAFSFTPRIGPVVDTSLAVASIHVANSTLSLTGAGAWSARVGDMISYYTAAGGYWIGEVTGNVEAVDGALTVPVWPFPLPPHSTLARPRRNFAFGEFYLTGRLSRNEDANPGFLEFEARQIVRRAGGPASPISPPAQDTNLATLETLEL